MTRSLLQRQSRHSELVPRLAGAYIIKCASTRPGPPPRRPLPADWTPPVPTEDDRSLVRALLRLKGRA